MKRGYLKYKYLPKYDLASKRTDPANMYLGINANDQADDVNKQTSMQLSNGIQSNMSSLVNNLSFPSTAAAFAPAATSTLGSTVPSIIPAGISASSLIPATSTLGSTASSLLIPAGSSLSGISAATAGLTGRVAGLSPQLLAKAKQQALTTGMKSAGKASLKNAFGSTAAVAGNILNLGSAIYNGIALGKGLSSMDKNVKSTKDLQGSVSTFNDNINGVGYQGYGGIDTDAEIKYMKTLDKQSTINNTTSGFGAGAGVGGLVGSIFPGAGS